MHRQEGEVVWWMFFSQAVSPTFFKTTAWWSSQEAWSKQTRQPIMPERRELRGSTATHWKAAGAIQNLTEPSWTCQFDYAGVSVVRKLFEKIDELKDIFFKLGCPSPKIIHLLSRQAAELLHSKECPYLIKLLIDFVHWLLSEPIVIWN